MSKENREKLEAFVSAELEHELIVIAEVVTALETIEDDEGAIDRVIAYVADRFGYDLEIS